MDIQFAERMKDYAAGIFQVLNDKKDEAEKNGRKIYNLSVGTPDFPPAAHVVNAVVRRPRSLRISNMLWWIFRS